MNFESYKHNASCPLTLCCAASNYGNYNTIQLPFRTCCNTEMDNVVNSEDEDDNNPFFQWMEGDSLAPPCHSDCDVIIPLLEFVEKYLPVSFLENPENGVFYDLGCGDGRVCLAATKKFSCCSIGVEIEEFLINRFRRNVERLGVQDKVEVIHGDLRELSFKMGTAGTVISMYLLPEAIELIKDKLLDALKNGAIVVCNSWGMKGVTPTAKSVGGFTNNVNFFLYTKECLD